MSDNKHRKTALKVKASPACSPGTKPVEIHLEYHFIETAPRRAVPAGAYAETFYFEDECGGQARLFPADGIKEITWRCRHPFVVIFEDLDWGDYFAPAPDAPYLYVHPRKIKKPVLVGIKSNSKNTQGGQKHSLKIQVRGRQCKPRVFQYALVPDLVPEGKGKEIFLTAQASGRGGISLSQ